jgi:hypothetical protein
MAGCSKEHGTLFHAPPFETIISPQLSSLLLGSEQNKTRIFRLL